jgi:hypothetical protein
MTTVHPGWADIPVANNAALQTTAAASLQNFPVLPMVILPASHHPDA